MRIKQKQQEDLNKEAKLEQKKHAATEEMQAFFNEMVYI